MTANTEVLDNGVIRFMHVTGPEQGSYICTATNDVGSVTSTAVINIEGGVTLVAISALHYDTSKVTIS